MIMITSPGEAWHDGRGEEKGSWQVKTGEERFGTVVAERLWLPILEQAS